MSSYWPVFAGAGAALILVSAGLMLAIGYFEKTGDDFTVLAVEWKPATTPAPVVPVTPAPAEATPQPTKRNIPSPQKPPVAVSAKVAVPMKDDVLPELNLPEALPIAKDTDKGIAKELKEEPPGALPRCETYGTAINFVRSPLLAAKHAQVEDKLVFTLHVSGNFEDPGFT